MKKAYLFILLGILWSCSNDPNPQPVEPKSELLHTTDLDAFIGKDYLIDDQHSYVGFKIKYFGFSPVRGRFDEFDGTLFYDPSSITDLSVSVVIDVQSINTGNDTRDNDLKSEGTWFDAATFPKITFRSTEVIPQSDGGFDLKGDLTMKGITKEVVINFEKPTALSKDWAGNDQVDFSGRLTINRQDFNVFGGDFWSSVMENGLTQLSDEVEIELDMHCRRADYQIRYESADSSDIGKMVLDRIKTDGLESGLVYIDELQRQGLLTSGKLSTIGYTLNAWKMYDDAIQVFNKRMQYFPERSTTWNQLGTTHLLQKDTVSARKNFKNMLVIDSNETRAREYLKLMDKHL